ncbi:MAG: hypothetical protein JW993_14575 [Sedimentisphaerales bacterium]|nr:hypothetical protein [Sedimentisphaerales bacterium]
MEIDYRQQKLDLVWASVFLAAFAVSGLLVLALTEASELQITAALMALGLLFAVVTVPLLLLFAGSGRGLCALGRILIVVQLLCHVTAVVMGIWVIAGI